MIVKGVLRLRIEPTFIGWKSKVQKKKCTYFISIDKHVVLGTCLSTGTSLFCYLCSDDEKRPVGLVYLDGKPKFPGNTDGGRVYNLTGGSINSHPHFK